MFPLLQFPFTEISFSFGCEHVTEISLKFLPRYLATFLPVYFQPRSPFHIHTMFSKPNLVRNLLNGKRHFSAFKASSVLYSQSAQFPAFKGPTKLFINNKFVDAISGKRFETLNPATGDVITTVSDGIF